MRNTLKASDAIIPTYFIGAFYRWLEFHNFNIDKVLCDASFDKDALLNCEINISYEQYRWLVQRGVELTDNPLIGIRFAETLELTSLGLVGYAAMSSPTVGESLEVIQKYIKLRAPLVQLGIIMHEDVAIVRFDETLDYGSIRRFMIECSLIAISKGLCTLTNTPNVVLSATVTYPLPADIPDYRANFAFPVTFSSAHNELHIPADLLKQWRPQADINTMRTMLEQCEQLLSSPASTEGLLTRIRDIILATPGDFPSLDKTAARLSVSSRTLRRELQKLGTSYQAILDDTRKKLAVDYLSTTTLSVEQIAHAMGYSDTSTFARAFRKWTGKAPSRFRKN